MNAEPSRDLSMRSLPVEVAGRIRGVLERELPASGVESAFVLWENEFSSLPAFGIVRFVQELGKRHEMTDGERRALRLSLLREIHLVVAGSSSEDAALMKRVPTRTVALVQENGSGAARIGRELLIGMAESSGRENREAFVTQFRELAIASEKLPGAVHGRIRAWKGDSATAPLVDVDLDTLRMLVHAGYSALCEVVGPSRANWGLSAALKRAETLDAASEVAPQSLL